MEPEHDGGTRCRSFTECNPAGQTCGNVHLCVAGYCSAQRVVRACEDGAYPDTGVMTGNCSTFEDCNPPPFCGQVVACINFRCEPDMPPIEIPCAEDAGTPDAAPADALPGEG
jgi:hypothetical protein